MGRRKKTKIPRSAVKYGLIVLVAVGLGWLTVSQTCRFFMTSDYFRISSIIIDPSFSFIHSKDLDRIKGKNIFSIDLGKFHRQLAYKYPQIENLKIVREFPNQIKIVATQRIPFAQVRFRRKTLTVDENAVVLSATTRRNDQLPYILGLSNNVRSYSLGVQIKNNEVFTALEIIKALRNENGLTSFNVSRVNVDNLSMVDFYLANKLKVIIDREDIEQKVRKLSLLLNQGQIDLDDVKYIDLRFNEPIIGRK